MLQQTQVATVVDYFNRFTKNFPTLKALALAPEDKVLSLWSGLGYYSRCRNLHKAAKYIYFDLNNEFPQTLEGLQKLPGVGSYTAGAIMAFAYDKAAPVVDGNISRVLARIYNDETIINDNAGKKHFESLNFKLVKNSNSPRVFQEGIMELGATICTAVNPNCAKCPISNHCKANEQNVASLLPKKMPPIVKQEVHVAYALCFNKNRILLQKRKHGKLYNGLYEPPNCALKNANDLKPLASFLNDMDLQAVKKPIFSMKRILTHRILHMHAYVLESSNETKAGEWFSLDDAKQVGMSKAVSVLIKKGFETKPSSL